MFTVLDVNSLAEQGSAVGKELAAALKEKGVEELYQKFVKENTDPKWDLTKAELSKLLEVTSDLSTKLSNSVAKHLMKSIFVSINDYIESYNKCNTKKIEISTATDVTANYTPTVSRFKWECINSIENADEKKSVSSAAKMMDESQTVNAVLNSNKLSTQLEYLGTKDGNVLFCGMQYCQNGTMPICIAFDLKTSQIKIISNLDALNLLKEMQPHKCSCATASYIELDTLNPQDRQWAIWAEKQLAPLLIDNMQCIKSKFKLAKTDLQTLVMVAELKSGSKFFININKNNSTIDSQLVTEPKTLELPNNTMVLEPKLFGIESFSGMTVEQSQQCTLLAKSISNNADIMNKLNESNLTTKFRTYVMDANTTMFTAKNKYNQIVNVIATNANNVVSAYICIISTNIHIGQCCNKAA